MKTTFKQTPEFIEQMDLAFWTARAKDKTLNRAEFNAQYTKLHAKDADKPKTDHLLALSQTAPSETHKKAYSAFATYCAKFPNVATPNIVLIGGTGTGKTMVANAIRDTLVDRDFWVEYTTAFNMVNVFQKFVNSYGRDDAKVQSFLDCDLLIIDDLGAEPTIRNVTQEHIYNVINERLVNKRPFIITTNHTVTELQSIYEARITSRLLSRETSAVLEFSGKDLRITKK